MSAFKALKDASNKFEEDLRRVSTDLFSAKIGESFDDGIVRKLRDISLFTSKVRLLRAKPQSLTPQILERVRDEDTTLSEYGEAVSTRIIEQQVVKSLTQAYAVKALINAQNKNLDPELVDRKEKILHQMSEYRTQESTLQRLDVLLREKEEELAEVRTRWHKEVGELRDMRAASTGGEEIDSSGPLYGKLNTLVDKMEMMRWLISKLAAPRTRGYDWLSDPHRRLAALKVARVANTVDTFVRDT